MNLGRFNKNIILKQIIFQTLESLWNDFLKESLLLFHIYYGFIVSILPFSYDKS